MPGSSRSRSTSRSGSPPRASSGVSVDQFCASAWIAPARLRMMPSSAIRSIGADREQRRRGEGAMHVGPGRRDVAAEALDQAAGEGARAGDRDLLAEHGAHRELEAVDAARQAQPRRAGQLGEGGVDRLGRGVEVEPAAHRRDDGAARRAEGRGERQPDARRLGQEARFQPAGGFAAGRPRSRRHAASCGSRDRRRPRCRGSPVARGRRAARPRRAAAGSRASP